MKILVALDGSDAAFNALRSACRIAKKTESYITVFYVNKGEEYSPEETGWTSIKERISRELETSGQEVMHKAYEIGKKFDLPIEGIISEGVPTSEILRYANAHGIIKLIAMGHSSKGRGVQEFVESTTKNVVAQSTNTPVFVTSSEIDIRSILIAVDESEVSQKATAFGGGLAKSLGAELGVVSFVPDAEALINEYRLIAEVPNIEKHIEVSEKNIQEMIDRAIHAAQKTLDSIDMRASSIVKRGRSDDIISEAKNYDLLIAGVKGDPLRKKINRTANKLLDSHETNIIFVQ
ncbi:MAG: universal stress protein [Nitrospirae bacterium]|nr:MAG: universal stress protein [Nitrospirota bacterium]